MTGYSIDWRMLTSAKKIYDISKNYPHPPRFGLDGLNPPPPPPDPIRGLKSALLKVVGFFLWVAPVVFFSDSSEFGFLLSSHRLRDSLPPSCDLAWSRSLRAASISFSRSARTT